MMIAVSPAYAEGFKFGFLERVRQEFRKNLGDLNNSIKDNRNFFKIKTSLWGELSSKDSSFYLRLTNENLAYTYWGGASAAAGKSASKKGYHYDINEVVFDNLYWETESLLELPLGVRLGRQDLSRTYGEDFLFSDGTPSDSSRTFYFNAAKASWRINPKNRLDFIYIRDFETDQQLPIINELDPPQKLNASDEAAYVLYHSSDAFQGLHLEDYYIYKSEEASDSSAARMTQKETELHTFGGFAEYEFEPWTLKGQLAYQTGTYGDNRRMGLGGYGYLDRAFKDAFWSPVVSLGFVYLSGDDRETRDVEAWDPLFSRWPWISDLAGQLYKSETETYYWTNLQMFRLALVLKPTKKIKYTVGYNFLRANEDVAATAALFSGSGRNRGHLLQSKFEYNLTKNISVKFLAEYFVPGNFYVKTADEAVHLKNEIQVKF